MTIRNRNPKKVKLTSCATKTSKAFFPPLVRFLQMEYSKMNCGFMVIVLVLTEIFPVQLASDTGQIILCAQ